MTKSTIGQFSTRFNAMRKAGQAAADTVQSVGLDVLAHYAMHKDVTLVNAYFKALPPGINYKAMTMWLTAYAAVRVNSGPTADAEPFKFQKDGATDVDAAKASPWYTMAGANVPKVAQVFSIHARMIALVKSAAKAEKLDGDFEALRKAAISMGVPASELPSKRDADLKAADNAVKASKAKGKGLDTKAAAEAADPLV